MLNVYLIRLRFISARLLASTPSISKGLRKGYFIMLLLKILNVPIPPRTAVALVSSACLPCKHVGTKCTGMYILYRACGTFLYAPSIFRTAKDGSGFIQERDLCYAQISSLSSCTRMYNCLTVYFQKAYGNYVATPLKTPLRIRR